MKHYFTFSKNEKIGAVAIAVVITTLLVILNVDNRAGLPDPFVLNKADYLMETESTSYSKVENKSKIDTLAYFEFNPNEFSKEEWEKFGFSEKQAISIVKYRSKIGGFKKKSDLKNVYVIDDNKYNELEPFIKIPLQKIVIPEELEAKKSGKSTLENNLVLLELNTAPKEALIRLKGIGEFTAKGIIEYRTELGGFHSEEQLLEVYGVSPENFEKIKTQISIDESHLKRMNVNELSITDLKKHPYISWTIATQIIDKRLLGKLSNLNFLKEEGLLSAKELKLLSPYINF